jgi:chromosomal replication initiation ATPase DnaA
MLLDLPEQFTPEKKAYLTDLWTRIILHISAQHDHKKLVTFLPKAGIINIEETEKNVYIGFANEFALTQAKKLFNKSFKEAVHELYNPQFNIEYTIYSPFSNGSSLLIDLKKVLNIKDTPKKDPVEKEIKSELSSYFGILFDPNFRFDNFVAGSASELAFAAAQAVAENP